MKINRTIKSNNSFLGILDQLSIAEEEAYRLLLLLPKKHKDFTTVFFAHPHNVGVSQLYLVTILEPPSLNKQKRMVRYKVKDYKNKIIYGTHFGNIYKTYNLLKQHFINEPLKPLYLYGNLSIFNGYFQINNAELIDKTRIKKIEMVYSSNNETNAAIKKYITAFIANKKLFNLAITNIFEHYELAKLGTSQIEFSELLQQLHSPKSTLQLKKIEEKLKMIAIQQLINSTIKNDAINLTATNKRYFISKDDLNFLYKKLPFNLTKEQLSIINTITKKINKNIKLYDIISGDVGTGKTYCYAIPSIAAAKVGMLVAVILPTEVLAEQIYSNIKALSDNVFVLNIQEIKALKKDANGIIENGSILVGTTAILNFLEKSNISPTLIIVDEEQKFGSDVKNITNRFGCHYIGATATCIPRTQQLIEMGHCSVHRLHHCHVKKIIKTSIFGAKDINQIIDNVKSTLKMGKKIIVIYPMAINNGEIKYGLHPRYNAEKTSAEMAYKEWNKAFPNNVALLHGPMKNEQKKIEIKKFRCGQTSIMIATSVIEVGFDDPDVQRVVVVHPEVFGLSSLHQIRGRVARMGGKGYMDLFLPTQVSEKTQKRLNLLTSIEDGFELAQADLEQRGFGDISINGKEQSGKANSMLIGHTISPSDVKVSDPSLPTMNEQKTASTLNATIKKKMIL